MQPRTRKLAHFGGAAFRLLPAVFFTIMSLMLFACSGPLQVSYNPKTAEPGAKAAMPVTVYVEDFKDARDSSALNPRLIGKVNSIVYDMNSGDFLLSENVSALVRRALIHELTASGYEVKTEGGPKAADFSIAGEVKEFSLNIASRDEISIKVPLTFTETETSRAVWAGAAVERSDRFAGVSGNSRTSLSNYITNSLSKALRKAITEANPKISNTKAAYSPAEKPAPSYEQAAPAGTGRVVISTEPVRSKVYIQDVFYGLTPLSLDIEPGVYEITVKQKGFKEATEKVSVRLGQFTELELTLEKE